VLRPLDALRLAPALGMIVLASCGTLGIDLDPDEGHLDGSGAATIVPVGGSPGDGGTGGEVGSGGASAGGGGEASGGTASGGAEGGSGGDGSGGVPASGGTAGAGGGSAGSGGEPCLGHGEADFSLVGWATEAGGTTGGKGGQVEQVWSGAQLLAALANKSPFTPLTILVQNTITQANTGDDKIDIADVEDVSIIGQGTAGVFDGIGLRVIRASNIVIRNVRIHHVDIGEMDAIGLAGPADHIWIDHCELDSEFQSVPEGTYDGLIDAKDNVAYVTYSWNYIHDSWNPILAGSTETDLSDRKLTMHHNRIASCDSGTPSLRAGNGHVFNNLFEDIATFGINTRLGACVRIENNVFVRATNPWVSAFSATLGAAEVMCNEFDVDSIFDFEAADVSAAEDCVATVPYDYSSVLNETGAVAALVSGNAGYGKLEDPTAF